jgi:uncharacterized membrane protein YsdA (DUF1294 family)/cold shock CspA family protein
MRDKGKVTGWKDEQGYGFVAPAEGGKPVFLHISGFARRSRRPANNDLVTYELGTDDKKRTRALRVRFSNEKAVGSTRPRSIGLPVAFAAGFLLFIVAETLLGRLSTIILAVYFGVSLIAFIGYAMDKSAARNNRRRTPESTLHVLALIGGWPGAAFAQRLWRHKSSKAEFQRVFWVTVVLNCAALGWLMTYSG